MAAVTVGVVTVGVVTAGVSGSRALESAGSIKPADDPVPVVPIPVPAALVVPASMGAALPVETPVLVLAVALPLVPVPAWPSLALRLHRICSCHLIIIMQILFVRKLMYGLLTCPIVDMPRARFLLIASVGHSMLVRGSEGRNRCRTGRFLDMTHS